jgi:hypothetical protein
MKRRYEVWMKDATVGSWIIEAESEEKARAIAEARLNEGDLSWRSGAESGSDYVEVVEGHRLD